MYLGIARRTTLVYGMGNHCWPQSRMSAGLYAVNKYAAKHNFEWTHDRLLQADIGRSKTVPWAVLVRPTCYLTANLGSVLNRTRTSLKVDPEDVAVVYHVSSMPVGSWKAEIGDIPKRSDEGIQRVAAADGATSYKRYILGVGKEPRELLDTPAFMYREQWEPKKYAIFLANKMPNEELRIFDKCVDDMMEYWDGPGFEEYRRTFPNTSTSSPTSPAPSLVSSSRSGSSYSAATRAASASQ